jgi:hypothetical protein
MLGSALKLSRKVLGPALTRTLYKNIGRRTGLQAIGKEALVSGGINTALGVLSGQDIPDALLYGAADALASGASIGVVRGLRPKGTRTVITEGKDGTVKKTPEPIRSRLELPANVAASIASTIPVGMLLNRGANPQSVQVSQQNAQRAVVNRDPMLMDIPLAGAYMPDTMFQNINLPSTTSLFQQYLNDQGPQYDMAQAEREMAAIMGLN